jgi:hypothetical protein
MKRDDIKPGGVYAYTEARPRHQLHAYYRPYLILSDRNHTYEAREPMQDATGRLVPAPSDTRMGRDQGWHHEPVGLPAVNVGTPDAPGYEDAVAELRERCPELLAAFRLGGRVISGNGNELGRYGLVTSLGYLHGEFAAMLERKADLQAQEDETQRRQDAEDARRLAEYRDLARRLAALGIKIDTDLIEHSPPRRIELSFEDTTVLISLAEYARQESRSAPAGDDAPDDDYITRPGASAGPEDDYIMRPGASAGPGDDYITRPGASADPGGKS